MEAASSTMVRGPERAVTSSQSSRSRVTWAAPSGKVRRGETHAETEGTTSLISSTPRTRRRTSSTIASTLKHRYAPVQCMVSGSNSKRPSPSRNRVISGS